MIRPKSKKRAKQDRASRSTLRDFAAEFPFCWLTGAWRNVETHHLAGRTHPLRHCRANLIRVSAAAHEERFTNPVGLSKLDVLATGLALKWIHDRDFYDLPLTLRMAGYGPKAITQEEVMQLVPLIKGCSDG